jgi:hypothetical protein
LDRLIEVEVERRVRERLARRAGTELESRPEVDQPGWYGTVRRRYGWPKWRRVPYNRKMFLVSFGAVLQNKAIERYQARLRVMCDVMHPFAEALESFVKSPTVMQAEVRDEDMTADWAIGCEITIGQWRRLAALYEEMAKLREPMPEAP